MSSLARFMWAEDDLIVIPRAPRHDLVGNERSGNWGHAGRPGEVGGSGPGSAASAPVLKDVDVNKNAERQTEKHLANWEAGTGERPTPEDLKAAEAELRALPLVHGTTVAGALGALEHGLLSNADMAARTQELKESQDDIRESLAELLGEEDARTAIAGGVWGSEITAEQLGLDREDAKILNDKLAELHDLTTVLEGRTAMADKRLGLDRFVFMSHGQKHQDYGTVGVIIDNEVVGHEGAFATEHDIVVTPGLDPDNHDTYNEQGVKNYQDTIVKGDGYYQTAAAKAGSEKGITNRNREG